MLHVYGNDNLGHQNGLIHMKLLIAILSIAHKYYLMHNINMKHRNILACSCGELISRKASGFHNYFITFAVELSTCGSPLMNRYIIVYSLLVKILILKCLH